MNGYWGKILKVDLSTGEISVEEPPESFYRRYLGGSGLIGYYLLKDASDDRQTQSWTQLQWRSAS